MSSSLSHCCVLDIGLYKLGIIQRVEVAVAKAAVAAAIAMLDNRGREIKAVRRDSYQQEAQPV